MGTKEESTPKASKSSSSTQEIPTAVTAPSYPDWSTSMQAYYTPGATPPPFYASTIASPTPHPYMWGSQHPLMPPYGTPVPYPALYPPGNIYAHPSMTMTPNAVHHTMEFEGKGPDGKDRDSSKKPKGTSAKSCAKAGESGKAGSGSGNDGISLSSGDSGSEDSSNASDENTRNKKGSFDLMLVDGANAQNNTAGPISQSSVPGKPVPGANLNMGMDLWNASSAGAEATKMRHNHSGAPGGVALGEPWVQDERELKRQKRKQSNRESARRSRLRKQAECEELQKRVEALGGENRSLREDLQKLSEECQKLASENNSIKEELERMCGPEAVANLG